MATAERLATSTLRFKPIAAASDGDNTVIEGTVGKSIFILGYAVNVNAAGVIKFQDSAGSPVNFATFEFTDGGGASYAGGAGAPAFEVTKSLNLEINNAAGVDCTGHITYVVV